jgi:hypothetical protein
MARYKSFLMHLGGGDFAVLILVLDFLKTVKFIDPPQFHNNLVV